MTTPTSTPNPSAAALAESPTPITDSVISQLARIPRSEGDRVIREHARQLERELTALRQRLERAEEDAKRLDWLETHGQDIHVACWKGVGAETNPWTIHDGDFDDQNLVGEANTLRETIDAAMSATSAKPGEGEKHES